ncbi:MAG: GDP-mannose 4,6-dehydratase [Candidatus Omnitrophica bacterium]|nr:GDP-mannose 4,6-dehydratase [Candidatus Omnitrophota bacterium]
MKILITGGCGFIGSHLVDALISRGEEIEIIDDLSTGKIENILPHLKNQQLNLWIDSVLNPSLVDEIVAKSDFVFHLASAVGVKTILDNPLLSLESNIEGTKNVFTSAAKHKKPVLFASTSETYGKNENVPFKEDADIVLGPTFKKRWGYACSKAIDEFLAFAFREERGLNVIIVRLFNTVGPGQSESYGMVLPRFVLQALANKQITVFGDGSQSRCFIHVKDVIRVFLEFINYSKAYGEIFNIGTTEEITIKGLADMVKNLTNSSSGIIFVNPDSVYKTGFEDMKRRVPDITKIKRLLNFTPEYSLEHIIKDVIKYFKV